MDIREKIRNDKLTDLAEQMVATETEYIKDKYGSHYSSLHEAFGVLTEEIVEADEEMTAVIIGSNDWFQEDIRRDVFGSEKLEAMRQHLIDGMMEMAQAVAVIDKTLSGVGK